MPTSRRKVLAALRDFKAEVDRLERFDASNQRRFSGVGPVRLANREMYLLTEAIFFNAYRAYENFVRDIFLLYCLEKQTIGGMRVNSYLKPRDFGHAELLIQSSMRFLDWTSPDGMIERAELYLKDGFPVKLPYTSFRVVLGDYKKVRNHIAHNSKESLDAYKNVLKKHYGTVPLVIPRPGEYLLFTDRSDPAKYYLLSFFSALRTIATAITT